MSTFAEKQSLQKVMKNLNKEIEQIRGRTMRGLIRATVPIRRTMDTESPKIPVDTSNLRHSWFVTTSKGKVAEGKSPAFEGESATEMASEHSSVLSEMGGTAQATGSDNKPLVIMGFSANYALPVHEQVGANYQRPGAGAKFFQHSLTRNRKKILKTIQEEARIK